MASTSEHRETTRHVQQQVHNIQGQIQGAAEQAQGIFSSLPNMLRPSTLWRAVLLQDAILYATLGVILLAFPTTFLQMLARMANVLPSFAQDAGTKAVAALLAKSDAVSVLCGLLGAVYIGQAAAVVGCLQCGDPTPIAFLHWVRTLALVWFALHEGWVYRSLALWAAHDLLCAVALTFGQPGKFRALLERVHVE